MQPCPSTPRPVGRAIGSDLPFPETGSEDSLRTMNDYDALQEVSAAIQQIQAQNAQLVERLLTCQQEIARHRRSIDLLRALPLEVHQRVGASLVQDLVQAESQRAADQAAQEFPEFLREVERRAQQRQSP